MYTARRLDTLETQISERIISVIASAAKQSHTIIISFERLSMSKQYYIYIMTNKLNSVLYIGVTSDLEKRAYEHKLKLIEGFTKKYNIDKLVYYEVFDDIDNAIAREKQIKAGSRQKKMDLIASMNPAWKDLSIEL